MLQDRVAIVTGAGQGIGRAIARELATAGAHVVASGRRLEPLQTLAGEIRARGRRALAVSCDVRDAAQLDRVVDETMREFGRIDLLVNNAGYRIRAPLDRLPRPEWDAMVGTNLTGVFLCCQAAARQMVRQGGGRIITTASINGFRGVENLVGYNAAKAGVIELTRTMAVELAQHRIAVNAIAPAQIDTRLTRSLPEAARRRRVERIPMARFGEPEEVARVALFLASDDASYVTGHTLAVDGGYLAGGLWSGAPDVRPPGGPPG